jgi:hypothetical protein
VYQNTNKTVIHFSADRDICDGWSVILFFKALAKCYTSLQNRQLLPDINYPSGESISKTGSDPKQQAIKRSLQAKTIHSTITMDSIPSQMMPKLFAYMLYSFYRALQETTPADETVISIPMAGQLLTHNLKVFDNCTVYFPCKFGGIPTDRDKTDIEQLVDQVELQLNKGKHSFSNLYVNQNHADIVFNMDSLDFELAFDNLLLLFWFLLVGPEHQFAVERHRLQEKIEPFAVFVAERHAQIQQRFNSSREMQCSIGLIIQTIVSVILSTCAVSSFHCSICG